MGHAARMIPVARKLLEMNNKVIIASGKEHLSLFRNELPGLSFIEFPGFKPGYSRFLPQYFYLVFKIPSLFYHIILEHHKIKKIIKEHDIDILISDNRFGLWSTKITSVYVTHMPLIPLPKAVQFMESIGVILHRQIIKRYSFCFIPDLPGDLNLSGRLSHGMKLPDNVRYIGILSRIAGSEQSPDEIHINFQHNTVILSGPEPQREILKQKLISVLKDQDPPTVIFEGKPGTSEATGRKGNIIFYSHLPSSRMKEILSGSKYIIARSGYSTIMELLSVNCTALIVPTPGQTEQEYLAEYLSEKGWFHTIAQNKIKPGILLPPAKSVRHEKISIQSSILLTGALNEMLEKHHKKSQSEKTG